MEQAEKTSGRIPMADGKKTGVIKDPNETTPCGRCGGEHAAYQKCNIDERIIGLNKEISDLREYNRRIEKRDRLFGKVVDALTSAIENLKAEIKELESNGQAD